MPFTVINYFLFTTQGPHLADALISSPIIQGEDGTGAVGLGAGGFEFVDPNEDPELALVITRLFTSPFG